jgi:hypothetical protein
MRGYARSVVRQRFELNESGELRVKFTSCARRPGPWVAEEALNLPKEHSSKSGGEYAL